MAISLAPGPIVVATHNPGKIRELGDMLAPSGIAVRSAGELGLPEPEETGTTFAQNAILKARAAAEASGLVALADDSGLSIDALNGDPGVYSARWAGPNKDFPAAMRMVEDKLEAAGATTPEARRAHFVAVLAVASPEGEVETFEGRVEGTIVWPPRGTNGFGYDPVFQPACHALTFGEMSTEQKHGSTGDGGALSHRARAFALFAGRFLSGPREE